jgi:hypothetical protein
MSVFSELVLSRYTSMAQSGQTIAQLVQPVQFGPVDTAGKYPLLLDFSEMVITLLGHTVTQRVQPLQRSISIIIFPAICVSILPQRTPRPQRKNEKNNRFCG